MSALAVTVEANFAGAVWSDITNDVLVTSGLTLDWGMDGGGPDDNCARPGTCAFVLNNAAMSGRLQGRYSPGHANCTAGFDLNLPIRVTLTDGASPRTLGPYRVADITPTPGRHGEQTVTVLAADWLEEAAESPVIYSGAVNVRGDEVITDILTNMDRQPTATSLDVGATTFNYPLGDLQGRGDRVLSALKSIAASEGGFVYLTSGGTLTFECRSRRAANTTNAYTLTNTMHGLSASRSRGSLVNALRLTVHPPELSSARVVIGAITTPFLLAAGASVYVTLDYRDPDTLLPCGGYAVAPPDSFLGDYAANTRSDGTGTSKSATVIVSWPFGGYPGAASMTYLVVNPDTVDFYITTLQVRGYSVVDSDPVMVESSSSASITAYGRRTMDIDLPYQSDPNVAIGLAEYWRSIYSDAATLPSAVSLIVKDDAALMPVVLGADVGTRIAITETMTAVSAAYWVQGVTLAISGGGVVVMTLRLAPASSAEYWLLGVAGRSELDDTTALGYA